MIFYFFKCYFVIKILNGIKKVINAECKIYVNFWNLIKTSKNIIKWRYIEKHNIINTHYSFMLSFFFGICKLFVYFLLSINEKK